MVKVLANGELVPDDDPRAQPSFGRNLLHQLRPTNRQSVVPSRSQNLQTIQDSWLASGASYIHSMNQRLNSIGIPTWQLGPYSVEPLFSIGIFVSTLLKGDKGLFCSVLFFLTLKYIQARHANGRSQPGSTSNSSDQHPQPNNAKDKSFAFSGTGHRLGQL